VKKQSAAELEPVQAASTSGWLSPAQAAAFLMSTFGRRIAVRSVQTWCHRSRNPLRHVVLGGRLLIHRQDLLAWVGRGGATIAETWPADETALRDEG
jgi:hypothetical protein